MQIDIRDMKTFFKGKKVLLCTLTKDLVNFVNLWKEYDKDFDIIGIVDITFGYRPSIKKIAETTELPLFESLADIPETPDIVIKFDHTITVGVFDEDDKEYFDINKFDIVKYEEKVKQLYFEVKNGSEYTYMLYPKYQNLINNYFVNRYNCFIFDSDGGYCHTNKPENEILPIGLDKSFLANEDKHFNLWDLIHRKTRKNQKPIFVISSDFGGGKYRYIKSKSQQENSDFLSPDAYVAVFDHLKYYGPGGWWRSLQDYTIVNAVLDGLLWREYLGKQGECYIKIEGSLECFLWPFITNDCYVYKWANLHNFFDDYRFDIICKDYDDFQRLEKNLSIFMIQHQVPKSKINLIVNENFSQSYRELPKSQVMNKDYLLKSE